VIAKAIDMHPVTDEPWHFDLYRVDAHQQIKIEVPVHFANQETSPGLKRGGTLGVILHTVTVSCHADSIPEEIVVDLEGLDIGDAVRISDLKLPAKVEAAMDGDVVVASITMSKAGTEEAEGETAAVEGGEA
jgi:large subunit ribosomal protein L25